MIYLAFPKNVIFISVALVFLLCKITFENLGHKVNSEIMSEKFSLKWNDYQTNWNKALNDMRTDTDLADVTLISDDKVEFSAHRILLSSCSEMFRFIFKRNINSNHLLFLGGVNSINLGFILDYIYYGEVNIFQEQLDDFLDSAEKLEIEGLVGNNQENFNGEQIPQTSQPDENIKIDQSTNHHPDEIKILAKDNETSPITRRLARVPTDHAIIDVGSMTPEEINQKMKELYEKTDNGWRCLVCSHTNTRIGSFNIRQHVETHMDGLCYTCNLCDKEFRSRNLLNIHKKSHKNMF